MAEVKKILVLGITGMLGSMVYRYFKDNPHLTVAGTVRNSSCNIVDIDNNIYTLDAEGDICGQLSSIEQAFKPHFVINCIGVINKYCNGKKSKDIAKAIMVNAYFPHKLANYFTDSDTKIIQIATDCVYAGNKGNYDENSIHDAFDVYGKTKSLGEVVAENLINIRCSIIGPELQNKSSLLEWFLAKENDSTIFGYSRHIWNGVTTLQFAKFCEKIIQNESFDNFRSLNHTMHFVENEQITKYQLLKIFNEAFQKGVIVKDSFSEDSKRDMTLSSLFLESPNKSMREAIWELKNYIDTVDFYKNKI
ncbi:MAG: sugar nucleotide-binding protein [Candidatus Cloacimonetes bacterium]|nr:sugar nucleotide-binding protein [Candidatus Cloacimonadota bacterium]